MEQRVQLTQLTTCELLDWLYVTLCRDASGGVDWQKVRDEIDRGLEKIAREIEARQAVRGSGSFAAVPAGGSGRRPPIDPETWGMTPDAVAAQERLMASLKQHR